MKTTKSRQQHGAIKRRLHRENLFTKWRTFDNSVHQDEMNIKVDVKRGDQISIQAGSAGEPNLSRKQIITIR